MMKESLTIHQIEWEVVVRPCTDEESCVPVHPIPDAWGFACQRKTPLDRVANYSLSSIGSIPRRLASMSAPMIPTNTDKATEQIHQPNMFPTI